MNCIIPFEDKVKFNYPVVEINSISLEHEYTVNETEVLGNFLLSGTCKEHKLSVNTTDFNFTIPFDVTVPEDIDFSTLELTIDNFTYDLVDNELNISISYIIKADDIIREVKVDEIMDDIDETILIDNVDETLIEKENVLEENREVNKSIYDNFIDDYKTYQIYVVKEEDTINSICLKYNVNVDDLLKLNNIEKINVYDKLLIPMEDD